MRAREREVTTQSMEIGRLIYAIDIAAGLLGLTPMELVELGELAEYRHQSEREQVRWRAERRDGQHRRHIPPAPKSETRAVAPCDEGDWP